MSEVILRDNTHVSNFAKPYIVAEINSSHGGSVELAKEMVAKAKEIGCDCVKFQSWSAESLYSKTYYDANPITKRIVQKFSLSEEQLLDIANYCKQIGVAFSSTPYSCEEVDFLLDKCNAPYIKIASMDINNYDYLRYIAQKNAPIVLSTGMAELDEIKKAVDVIEKAGNSKIILLHCISIYPAAASTIHLNNIVMLRETFPNYPIGFSDHTLGTEISSAAIALGAALIEKHFTLDKSKMGMDNNMAIEPDEFAQLIQNCHNVYEAMGSYQRVVSEAEYAQRKKMRRSVIALHDMEKGHVLVREDLGAKRPGDGISVSKIDSLVGKRLNRSIVADTLIYAEDVC